ncbi:MAG TPA: ATP-binding protein, partial [Anaeromyxobacteraceae bacterium]|nr:ATP-binding protein [Anaeromyxobacteraceae bacterium]
MHSGRDFAWIYDRQDQVSFLDGHVRAFEYFGAVPLRLVYDNLRAAVTKILVGSERKLTARFEALAAHYVFEPCFARPRTGHDEGGVEARGKSIRLQHLVPIPAGDNLDAISTTLVARLERRAAEERDADGRTIHDRFADERGRMLPLPAHAFRPHAVRLVAASRRSLVKVEGAAYSVPCEWAGLELTAHVGAAEIEIAGPTGRVVYPRLRFGQRCVRYRHYIRELARKPQALRQVADELITELGEPFATAWRHLVDEQGPSRQPARSRRCSRVSSATASASPRSASALRWTEASRCTSRSCSRRSRSPSLPTRCRWRSKASRSPPRLLLRHAARRWAVSRAVVVADMVKTQARTLKMPGLLREYESLGRQAREEKWSHEEYLHEVLAVEIQSRAESAVRQRIRDAHFPETKTLDTFDFNTSDGIDAVQIAALARGRWVADAENLIFAGPIGTGRRTSRSRSGSRWRACVSASPSGVPPTSSARSSRRATRASSRACSVAWAASTCSSSMSSASSRSTAPVASCSSTSS